MHDGKQEDFNMANWNDPTISTLYVQFLADLKARDSDLAKMFDVGTPTNVETDTIRWDSSAVRFEKWNGAAWVELASTYNINADKLDGSDASDFAAASHVGSGGAAHADVTGAVDGFMKAVDKTKLDNATSAATANELIDRDASGRAQVAVPSAAADIARKDTVDTVQTNLDTHAALTNPHSATAAAIANRIALRDGSGRMKVVSPSVDADVANKGYVDGIIISSIINRDVTETEVVNTTTQTSIYSFSVSADTFGTTKILRTTIRGEYFNNSGANKTLTWRIKLGATTMFAHTTGAIGTKTSTRSWSLIFDIAAINSDAIQKLVGVLFLDDGTSVTTGFGNIQGFEADAVGTLGGDATEDTTGALTLDVTIQHSSPAHANTSIKQQIAYTELL